MEPIEEKHSPLSQQQLQQPSVARPIPIAVLKLQFRKLVDARGGSLPARELLDLIDQFEDSQSTPLLSSQQKKVISHHTYDKPELQMTTDDVVQLVTILFTPAPTASISCPSSDLQVRPRTSVPLTTHWKRRASVAASLPYEERKMIIGETKNNNLYLNELKEKQHELGEQEQEELEEQQQEELQEDQQITIKEDDTAQSAEEEDSDDDMKKKYRRSLKLTQKLKASEQSLALLARDNDDKIVQLQNKVDDMNNQVLRQRREIQEYKSKEKKSLEQISDLEEHIERIHQSETDQKQVHKSIKRLFDEKCDETQKLQELLREKESHLEKTESLLKELHDEVGILDEEKQKLMDLHQKLEKELKETALAHEELAKKTDENKKLQEEIDNLKYNLDNVVHQTGGMIIEPSTSAKTLDSELDTNELNQSSLSTVQDDNNQFKNPATKEDFDCAKNELDDIRYSVDNVSRTLGDELTELKRIESPKIYDAITTNNNISINLPNASLPNMNLSVLDIPVDLSATTNILPLNTTSVEMDIPTPAINDFWSQNRMRQRHRPSKKKRAVMDLHESSSNKLELPVSYSSRNTMSRRDDKIVTNTVTFALYTVLIYFFGIVTSTFLMEGSGTPPGWEQALAAAASGQVPKSKLLEIILYWLEKLLIEPQGLPVS